ncbi:hypothetical protein Zm00014a_026919 [Zea mays]|uniref:Uncharacterized protein n=1 Tax=Zea mays TaxID=4577 RepID=A0A3L6DNT9_MAIZE|nr:hypothetical protein Zm00014a_026919 [Zea mays]
MSHAVVRHCESILTKSPHLLVQNSLSIFVGRLALVYALPRSQVCPSYLHLTTLIIP